MDDLAKRQYTGTGKCQYNPRPNAWNQPEPYLPSKPLVDAVNTALYLRRPLLLEGEPGCGKTRLAFAVAYELGYPLYQCYIRSTSRAQDLLYDYDALRRLYDIQEKVAKQRSEYVTLKELGEAIKQSEEDNPSVILIDEVDKADIDFPNDLLLELDRLQFQVKEDPEVNYDALKGKKRDERREFLPLIIITSNREKELPKAFLRRCLFYYIDFPTKQALEEILKKHFQPKLEPLSKLTPMFEQALTKFLELRELRNWRKKPGTSEFLDWVAILERDEQAKKISAQQLESTDLENLPHLETLIKIQSDREALNQLRT